MKRITKKGKWLVLRFNCDYTFPSYNQPTYEKNGEVRTVQQYQIEDDGSISILYKVGKSKKGCWVELSPNDTKLIDVLYKALDKDEVKAIREEYNIDELQNIVVF